MTDESNKKSQQQQPKPPKQEEKVPEELKKPFMLDILWIGDISISAQIKFGDICRLYFSRWTDIQKQPEWNNIVTRLQNSKTNNNFIAFLDTFCKNVFGFTNDGTIVKCDNLDEISNFYNQLFYKDVYDFHKFELFISSVVLANANIKYTKNNIEAETKFMHIITARPMSRIENYIDQSNAETIIKQFHNLIQKILNIDNITDDDDIKILSEYFAKTFETKDITFIKGVVKNYAQVLKFSITLGLASERIIFHITSEPQKQIQTTSTTQQSVPTNIQQPLSSKKIKTEANQSINIKNEPHDTSSNIPPYIEPIIPNIESNAPNIESKARSSNIPPHIEPNKKMTEAEQSTNIKNEPLDTSSNIPPYIEPIIPNIESNARPIESHTQQPPISQNINDSTWIIALLFIMIMFSFINFTLLIYLLFYTNTQKDKKRFKPIIVFFSIITIILSGILGFLATNIYLQIIALINTIINLSEVIYLFLYK